VLIQQNVGGSNFFNRSWAEFKVGFNDTNGNYWLGNELLHQLTQNGRYKVRFDLKAHGFWYWAEYSSFVVLCEMHSYQLQVSGYSGNAGDALTRHNNMMFSTYDRDNDRWTNPAYNNNCAVYNGGGFWHKDCACASINTARGRGDDFRWHSPQAEHRPLQTSRMWLTC